MPNPYCQKRNGTWYLRVRIPADIAPLLGRQKLRSLGTGRASEARALAAGMVARAPRWWSVLRSEIMAMILGKPISQLTVDDLTRENLPSLHEGFDLLDAEARIELGRKLDELLRASWFEVRRGKDELRFVETVVDAMQDSRAKGVREGLERALTLGGGRVADTSSEAELPPAIVHKPADPERLAMSRKTMSQLLPTFFERKNAHGDKSRISFEGAVKKFEDIIGKRPISRITEADVQKYVDALLAQPGRNGRAKAALATVAKNVSHVRTLLEWAATGNRRYIPSNPAATVELPAPDADDEGMREGFSNEQIDKIFRSPLFKGHFGTEWSRPGPHLHRQDRFYFFLAMYLTGARNTELVGSKVIDVGGIACLFLPGTKNSASKRSVPMLPEMHRTGFVDWARKRIESGGRLFEGDGAVQKWTDFPSRYLRDIGVSGPQQSAYSLRHAHRRMLRASGISQELMDKTFGHQGTTMGARYSPEPIGPEEARLWLDKVQCPVNLSHLYVK